MTQVSPHDPKNQASAPTRIADVMLALAENQSGASVRALAENAHLSRSATHRSLQALAENGYVTHLEDGAYAVGPRMLRLAAAVMSGSSFIDMANTAMQQMSTESGESVYLALLDDATRQAVFVHRVQCDKPIQYVQNIGSVVKLHVGAAGRAILAYLNEEFAVRRATEEGLDADDLSTLNEQLNEVRRRGYAISAGERIEGAAAIAAPIRFDKEVKGALSITMPISRIPEGGLETLAPIILRGAASVSYGASFKLS